ncbi:dUTP diphosphatase [Pseudoclavibacter sp. RFBG4]|uniref:dUTP diphosphatase n=1 Tax=Pseudoclavibacter sp. RFBG4 TaxID=2080575 RepID=UPI001CA51A46|nr:dUTP diphosphatase [Pseudoclavibacter sp. RFBG4]
MSIAIDVPVSGVLPTFAQPGDAGADLIATESVTLAPGQRAVLGTGVRLELPAGTVGFVMPRSGLAAKHGITLVNAPGTIDSGYRGEVKVIMLNTDSSESYAIAAGDRIAQLVVMQLAPVRFIQTEQLSASQRGEGGFGSTGYSSDQEAPNGTV